MLDAGFMEARAVRHETMPRVETEGRDLRIQGQLAPAALPCQFDQRRQQGIADAASAPIGQHGHAPDLVFGREPAGADRQSAGIARDDMQALRIERVPFFLDRDVLFLHEDGFAHRAQFGEALLVVDRFDTEGQLFSAHAFSSSGRARR